MHTLFSNTCALLSNYEWIHNFQVTDVFKGDVLSKIPANWHSCLAQLNTEEINEVPFLGAECRLKYPEWPSSLHDFITNSTELSSLKDVDLQESEVKHIEVSHDMARGMNRKKLHEVTRMASLVYETARKTNCNVVIDVGSGLGYLDHVIHQKYGINVLGMETVQSHVSAAETRAVKQGITCGGIKSLQCHIADNTDSFENFVSTVESVCPTLQCKCTERLTDSREWETKAKPKKIAE